MHAPSLKDPATIATLPTRYAPYWNILEYCRHVGVQKQEGQPVFWVARVRQKNGNSRRARLAPVLGEGEREILYDDAVALARAWFASPEIQALASTPYPVGATRHLKYLKTVSGFTVGDAMRDYVEWKRIAASRTHFETGLSLINHHIIPRIGDVPLEDFTARRFTAFCREVLEAAPKRGNQRQGPSCRIEDLEHEALRKRKKTLNALISILRLAIRIAWENGETDSERAWRCLRRVPSVDVPRHIFLTRVQCRELLAACRGDLAELVRGALYTGCRVSELERLRIADVAGDFFGLYIAPSKNGRARRIHMPEEGMRFFLDLCEGKESDARVFLMQSGNQWRSGHRHLFKAAVREAGLPEAFVFHGLRHTYASQLVQAGMPLAIVARQLGHSNTDTVSRTYGHLSCSSIQEEMERRFVPIYPSPVPADGRIAKLRHSCSSSDSLDQPHISWPSSNFSLAHGELVASLRFQSDRHRRALDPSSR